MDHIVSSAANTWGGLEHVCIAETEQKPCARNAENGILAAEGHLFQVQSVTFDEKFQRRKGDVFLEVAVDSKKQGSMDIRLPTHKPVGGIGEHAL